MVETDLKYLKRDRSRHQQLRLYVRIGDRKIRLRAPEGSPAFMREYADAVDKLKSGASAATPTLRKVQKGTLEWIVNLYVASVEFKSLEEKSQRTRRAILTSYCNEPPVPGSQKRMGDCPIAKIDASTVRMLRDRKAKTPGAANNRLKYLSAMFRWAIETGEMKSNPTRDVRALKYESDGWRCWEEDEIAKFEARWPIGTKQRLALALMMFTGTRRVDMVQLGPQHIIATRIEENGAERTEDWIKFKPSKTKKSTGLRVDFPLLPELEEIIRATTAVGIRTFLVTGKGAPFTANGFGNWFRDACDAAGLPECTAHGVRKAGATRAAERGATTKQLMAIFGWKDPSRPRPISARPTKRGSHPTREN